MSTSLRILTLACLLYQVSLNTSESLARSRATQLKYDSLDQAREVAREQGIPILLHFYTDWCGPCQRMEQSVFSAPRLKSELGGELILVKVNADRMTGLARKYQVDSYPTDVFIDGDGRVVRKLVGAASYQEFVRSGLEIAGKYRKSQQIVQQREEAGKNPRPVSMWQIRLGEEGDLSKEFPADPPENRREEPRQHVPDSGSSGETITADREKQPEVIFLALDGYCPVALKEEREWAKGQEELNFVHKQQRYRFSGQSAMREFMRNPQEFAPRLLGCDPVIMWESDRAIPGSTAFAAYYDDELYLFTSEENRRLFELDPERYSQTRHVLAPRHVEATLIR